LPLALPKAVLGTRLGTNAGAATLKPTVPTAPIKPKTARSGMDTLFSATQATNPKSARVLMHSLSTMIFCRETLSASKPSGIENNRNGNV
jgi:hypothetical protein